MQSALAYLKNKYVKKYNIWEKYFLPLVSEPEIWEKSITSFIENRNHVAHNKLLDYAAKVIMLDDTRNFRRYIQEAVTKFDKEIVSEEVEETIQAIIDQREYERESLLEIIESETGVKIRNKSEIVNMFQNTIDDIYSDMVNRLYFNDKYERYFWKLYNKRNSDVNVNKLLSEMESLTNNNIWFKYFQEVYEGRKESGKDGWIDFESEISRVVQTLDDARHTIAEQINRGEKKGKMTQQQFDILRPLFRKDWSKNFEETLFEAKAINYRKELLLKDLKRLVRCLEIYLSDYIFNLEVSRLLPDIESLPIINKVYN